MTTIIDIESTYTSGVYSKRPLAIVRGSGATLWDAERREYIDCVAGHGVANIGHGRPEIAAVLAFQAQRLITCPEIFYNDVRARLLERLARLTPERLDSIFLCNSGTEAVEGALKFARLATGRTGIIAMLRSFHGRSMGALSATWEPHYREPFAPLIPGVSHIRFNDLAAAETAINEETAAVIIELVQGEGGVHVASHEYINGLADLCHEHGAMLIIDEVQTAFGRTGRLFACNHYGLQPDILCLAKSLAGGLPMGAICLGPRIIESGRITKGVHGSTFGGNPLACAAALTTLDILEREELPQRAATLGTYALDRLQALRSPLIHEVRGSGLLLGIELNRRVQPYLEALSERGVLALPAGPNVIRLLPPLVITEAQLERVLDAIEEVLEATRVQEVTSLSANDTPPSNPTHNATAGADLSCPPPMYRPVVPAQADVTACPSNPADITNPEISLLYNMLTIPSYSGQERALASYLVGQAQQLGLHASLDDVGNFIASTHPLISENSMDPASATSDSNQHPIILLGHMDTVHGNIPVKLQDGLLYGRGAVDAKGPLAAFLCATARFASRRGQLITSITDVSAPGAINRRGRLIAPSADVSAMRPILVIGAVEEESATSRGAHAIVNRYQPAACIIGEPSGSQSITIGYKGRLLVEYCVIRPSHHSASIVGADLSRPSPIDRPNGSIDYALAFWGRVHSHADAWNQQHATDSAFAALTPSLRSISSNHDGLQEQTRLLIGYRLPPAYDIAGLCSRLEKWASEDGVSLSFSSQEAAFQTTRTTPLARAFITAIRATGGQPTFKHKTGTSDMNVVGPIWGQNIVAYGPGDSRLDHTPEEHIRIAEYLHAIDVLELVLESLFVGADSSGPSPIYRPNGGSEQIDTRSANSAERPQRSIL